MSLFLLDLDPGSSAFKAGYAVGTVLGVLAMLGAFVFSIVAFVKAITRRTPGWIVAGSIGGCFLLVASTIFAVGIVNGFLRGYQNASRGGIGTQTTSASPDAQIIRGRDVAYQVTLPPGWTVKRGVSDFDLMASRSSLYFTVIAEDGDLGTPETVLNFAQNKLRRMAGEVQFGEASTVRIDGRDWLTFTARCQISKIPFAYQMTVYAGPEGSYQLVGWTLQNLFDRDVGTLRNLSATFHFPPASPTASQPSPGSAAVPPQVLTGDNVGYKLTVPDDWAVKRKANAFDLEVSHHSAYVGVVAEEGSLGTPQVILKIVQDHLGKKVTDLQLGETSAIKIDGRDWLQFNARCKASDIPLAYHYYVYAGPEGSFQIIGWSIQNLYDRNADQINAVAMTFQFPPGVPAAPPSPAATSSPSPAPGASPAAPTPTLARPKKR